MGEIISCFIKSMEWKNHLSQWGFIFYLLSGGILSLTGILG